VDDLAALYDRHRVFIAPTRFAGGIPFKVHEAASYGLPVVASELLRRQVGWTHAQDIMAAPIDDPQAFADAILTLYDDAESWNTVRRGALNRLAAENDRTTYVDTLRDILDEMRPQGGYRREMAS
jgi:glycosyltransferase involved in cell wall biosynthesis